MGLSLCIMYCILLCLLRRSALMERLLSIQFLIYKQVDFTRMSVNCPNEKLGSGDWKNSMITDLLWFSFILYSRLHCQTFLMDSKTPSLVQQSMRRSSSNILIICVEFLRLQIRGSVWMENRIGAIVEPWIILRIKFVYIVMKKKEQVSSEVPLWGKPGNTLKMGIVGMPNVGKSTTFNLLSKLNVPAENYPFCTIEPNKATVPLPDERFNKLAAMFRPKSEVGAVLQIVDIAGLVPGASKGEGLGNAFLSHIKEVDGIYHVLRAFDSEDVTHTENEVDPIRDAKIISTELALKDLEFINNRIEDLDKKIKRNNDKDSKEEKQVLEKAKALLEADKWVKSGEWKADEITWLNTHRLLTCKPIVYLINLSEEDFIAKKNKFLGKLKTWITENLPGDIIPYSAEFEKNQLHAQNAGEGATKSMLSKIIRNGYSTLDLINYYTFGETQVRAWTIRKRTKAPGAAGVIHTDFEKGFICAEVMKYEDLIHFGSEHNVKAEGKYKQHGKEYVVEDGDIIYFKFNVGKGK